MRNSNYDITRIYYQIISEHFHVYIHTHLHVHTHVHASCQSLTTYHLPGSTLDILCRLKLFNPTVDSNKIHNATIL